MILKLPEFLDDDFSFGDLNNLTGINCDGRGGNFDSCLNFLHFLEGKFLEGFVEQKALSCHGLIFINCDVCYLKPCSFIFLHYPIFSPCVSSELRVKYLNDFNYFFNLDFTLPSKGVVFSASMLNDLDPFKFRFF